MQKSMLPKKIKKDVYKKVRRMLYSNACIGKIKQRYFSFLLECHQFDKWHVSPINFRPYALGIVDYLNEREWSEKEKIVEIGCGLGEIIGNINVHNKVGYDIDANVIGAARKIYPGTKFKVGTFEDIKKQNIECLITVNFIHGTSPEELRKKYTSLCEENHINYFILDIVRDERYEFNHSIDYLFDGLGYRVKKRLRMYKTQHGYRWIYIMKKNNKKYAYSGENI